MKDSRSVLVGCFGPGKATQVARAPGRVNLIGEHTDYNGGYVLPFAIDRWTEVALRPRQDRKVLIFADVFQEAVELTLPIQHPVPTGGWEDYLKGILIELSRRSELRFGFEGAITGNVPLGAGLSSSASLEVALAVGLSQLYGVEFTDLELVKLCQRAESESVGTICGIMDQYVSLLAHEGTALLLDVAALRHRYIPLSLKGATFLVVDSGVRRTLSQSGYNERRRECQEALDWFMRALPDRAIHSLSDVTRTNLDRFASAMPKVLLSRTCHVISENERVLAAAAALEQGDAAKVGELLFASHASLRDLFQVSTPQLDFLVKWGRDHGALGARLVGGGFGGVTLHLVPAVDVPAYTARIVGAYRRRFDKEASVLTVTPGPGAKQLMLASETRRAQSK